MRTVVRSLAILLIFTSATVRAETLLLRGAIVYVDAQTAPLGATDVLVSDGKIAAIGGAAPAGTPELDCRGLTDRKSVV